MDEARAIAPFAEQQMQRWALGVRVQKQFEPAHALDRLPQGVRPYITISREAGAGGGEIGRRVAERLGFPCLDHQLLTYMAERYDLPEQILKFVDETTSGWIREVFRRWLDSRVITTDEYVMRLGELVLLAARDASAVFVGRGVQFLLPRDRGLAIRVIAPLERRIERVMAQRKMDRQAADAFIRETEQGRCDFIRQHFHQDPADPGLYDAVLNVERLSHDAAVAMIVEGFGRRFGAQAGASVA